MGGLILSEFNIDNVFKVGIFADLTSLNPPSCSSGRRRLAGSCIQFLEPGNEWQSEVSSGQSGVQCCIWVFRCASFAVLKINRHKSPLAL